MGLLDSDATRKVTSKATVPQQRRQAKHSENKKIQQLPDWYLILLGSKIDTKVEILKLNKLKVPFILFAINVGVGTRVAAVTPWMIIIPMKK